MQLIKSAAATLLIGVGLLTSAFAQPESRKPKLDKEQRQAIKTEVHQYIETNVIPVAAPIREELDNILSSSEQAQLAEIRGELKAMHEQHRAKMKEMRDIPREERQRPTEAQREEMRAEHEAKRKLMHDAWTIFYNHEDAIKASMETLKPNAKTWKTEIHEIVKSHMPERPEGAEREARSHEGRRGHHGHHGMHGQGHGRKGMHGLAMLHSPVAFLLWDPSQPLPRMEEPAEMELNVFPNPSTGFNTLEYQVQKAGKVTIDLLDKSGQLIRTVYTGTKSEGEHSLETSMRDLNSGVYIYRITTESGISNVKVIKE
ncbi:T9SS type A sorting domain-containing protein [Pontibacter sp. G13]|uniref:T9SS type A sorting domain-containing protein n=1 Tax=Pontibacter sp. G13 TaxID=3074898 RepID=UPI002889F440|nr:T9SS type A sorting domain-containing protein [Pontibacter sp. G13]WNJ18585.1 T9SS type A sorting domain-containing protein [Pontibacter sp. G13]